MSENTYSNYASNSNDTNAHRGVFSNSEAARSLPDSPSDTASSCAPATEQPALGISSDLSTIHTALAKYTDLQTIGAGGQGTMLRAIAPDGTQVAIKVFDIQKTDSLKSLELFEREIDTLKHINVHGVPKFIEDIRTDRYLYLVEDYIAAPSLEKRMQNGERFTFQQILTLLENAAKILDELDNLVPPVIHRDIKPANLLVDDDFNVTLVDFGVVAAKVQESFAMTFAGTAGYLAPEQLYGKATPASDVFSLGVTIAHLVTQKAPCDMSMDGMKLNIDRYIPANIPKWFTVVLNKMIDPDPTNRLQSGKQVIDYLKKAEDNLTENHPQPDQPAQPQAAHATPSSDNSKAVDPEEPYTTELSPTYINFDFEDKIKMLKLFTLEGPWFLILISLPVFLIINYIFIGSPFLTFFTDWLPGILPIIMILPCIVLDSAPPLTEIIEKRSKLINNAKDLNDLYKRELLNPTLPRSHSMYAKPIFASLSQKLTNPDKFPPEELMPLTPEEDQRLDQYLNNEEVLYPCLRYKPSGDFNFSKFRKTFIFHIILVVFLIVLSFFSAVSLWWQIVYFALIALFIFRTIRFYTSHHKHHKFYTDPRHLDAYNLYVRRFLEECRNESRQSKS